MAAGLLRANDRSTGVLIFLRWSVDVVESGLFPGVGTGAAEGVLFLFLDLLFVGVLDPLPYIAGAVTPPVVASKQPRLTSSLLDTDLSV